MNNFFATLKMQRYSMNDASTEHSNDPTGGDTVHPPLIQALCRADAYPHAIVSIGVVETHISWLLLTGEYVYKIKKPVDFGFLDFSTLERRRLCCEEELRLNRRLAPDLYLDVVPITGTPEHPQIAGTGPAFEYAVKMVQFPAGQLLSERAECGRLEVGEIDQIARLIAEFHESVERADESSLYGNSDVIQKWFMENLDTVKPLLADDQQLRQLESIQAWGDEQWRGKADLMQLRKRQGYVRECHGDLHLNNITLINGKVTLFDCIEFNPTLRWIDVISEIAFLFIDLLHVGHERLAYRFLNHYLHYTGDYFGLALLRYYLVYRAMVRAKVTMLRMAQQRNDEAICMRARAEYAVYANLAERFTKEGKGALLITHGYSASGKSTLASQLVERLGAIQIRSDVERKRLFGYRMLEITQSGIDQGLYTQEAGRQTFLRLAELAKAVIEAGFTVIVDATFIAAALREQFRTLASECGVPFLIIDFKASEQELYRRIEQRQQLKNDASEATLDVLKQQLASAQPLSADELNCTITVDTEMSNALDQLFDEVNNILAP
jgi:aminoglycoside phosphotransferase family enzyme/predicted kinase